MTVPERNLRDVGYLLVGETFLVSQRQNLTKFRWQFIHCFLISSASSACSRIVAGLTDSWPDCMYFFIKSCCQIDRLVLFEQSIGGISDNRQQPSPAVGAVESAERFERTQISLLNDVLRILFVAKQPSRQIVRSIKMRAASLLQKTLAPLSEIDPALRASWDYGEFHNLCASIRNLRAQKHVPRSTIKP